jgi:LemA protein
MTAIYVILGVVALLVVIGIVQYNKLVRLNVAVDEGFAQIEVQLQRRGDLIPNLVETVKGYASHEKETFEKVVQARAQATAAQGVAAVAEADGMLTQALRGLLAVAESYPDLKASANFLSLQEELSGTENKVGFARQYYNDTVRSLNESIVSIPGKFFAGPANVVERDFYVVDDPTKRVVPNVSFN